MGVVMHELGVLNQVVKTVGRIAEENRIPAVRHITLEVGAASGFVPQYLHKLFPVAVDACPALRKAELRIETVAGKGLTIKEIGY